MIGQDEIDWTKLDAFHTINWSNLYTLEKQNLVADNKKIPINILIQSQAKINRNRYFNVYFDFYTKC